MSRPPRKGVLQLATWISARLKNALVDRAKAEGRSQRDVLEEALAAKLDAQDATSEQDPAASA